MMNYYKWMYCFFFFLNKFSLGVAPSNRLATPTTPAFPRNVPSRSTFHSGQNRAQRNHTQVLINILIILSTWSCKNVTAFFRVIMNILKKIKKHGWRDAFLLFKMYWYFSNLLHVNKFQGHTHTQDTSAISPLARPSFFSKLSSRFSKRWVNINYFFLFNYIYIFFFYKSKLSIR